jgi:hypothetical protein
VSWEAWRLVAGRRCCSVTENRLLLMEKAGGWGPPTNRSIRSGRKRDAGAVRIPWFGVRRLFKIAHRMPGHGGIGWPGATSVSSPNAEKPAGMAGFFLFTL